MPSKLPLEVRLVDFEVGERKRGATLEFLVTAFGLREDGTSCALHIHDVYPTVFIRTEEPWTDEKLDDFFDHLVDTLGEYWMETVVHTELVQAGFLYGFDNNKQHQYVKLEFINMKGLYAIKGLFFIKPTPQSRTTRLTDYTWGPPGTESESLKLCESTVPPLLRAFHSRDISPAGWIQINASSLRPPKVGCPQTRCDEEYSIRLNTIVPMKDKETPIPMKTASFDIEASSSHGDFPVAIKGYDKPANELVAAWDDDERTEPSPDCSTDDAIGWIASELIKALDGEDSALSPIYAQGRASTTWGKTDRGVSAAIARLCTTRRRAKLTSTKPSSHYRDDEPEDVGPRIMLVKKARTLLETLEDEELTLGEKSLIVTEALDSLAGKGLPLLEGDCVTFIGTSFRVAGSSDMRKTCICVGESAPVPGCDIINVATERDALLAWRTLILEENPQVVVGYNTYGFDYGFLLKRANFHKCARSFLDISCLANSLCGRVTDRRTSECSIAQQTLSIASGTHELEYIHMPGRINIDLYSHFRKEVNLDSYKLDDVAGHYIGDVITQATVTADRMVVSSRNLYGLEVGNYIVFEELGYAPDTLVDGKKFLVCSVESDTFSIDRAGTELSEVHSDKGYKTRWRLAKDDVGPQDIFRLTESGTPEDLAIVAKYCIADTTLVHYLLLKTDVLTGYTEMANICSVPTSFLVTRGQGIKLQSYLAKRCRQDNIIMPDLDKRQGNEAYEGATVLDAICKLYQDEPIACVDFSSLYPSCSISDNISHDTKVWTKQYNLAGQLIEDTTPVDFVELPDYEYVEISFDTYAWRRIAGAKKETKCKTGRRTCCWAQLPDGEKGVIPSVLRELLAARKATRQLAKHKIVTRVDGTCTVSGAMKKCANGDVQITSRSGDVVVVPKSDIASVDDAYDEFMKNVFDKRQLGYKVTANSVYGQTGAKTSAFYEPDIAASITAMGRSLLLRARDMVEAAYVDKECEVGGKRYIATAKCVYGDTDSLFISFNLRNVTTKEPVKGREARYVTIELGKEAGLMVTKTLKAPHDLEYEKTYDPWILLSAKRYAGMLYECDPDATPKLNSMGIVLKRRDNAPIVKDMYGGVLSILMDKRGVDTAVAFTIDVLRQLMKGDIPMQRLVITKSLRGNYKNPRQIAHKVLADRIAQRDPGNTPRSGDRIGYVYVVTKGASTLQGDRIETPQQVMSQQLPIDYQHYVTNQIMKPLLQVFALVLEQIPGWCRQRGKHIAELCKLQEKHGHDPETLARRQATLRLNMAKELVFSESLRRAKNKAQNQQDIHAFFISGGSSKRSPQLSLE